MTPRSSCARSYVEPTCVRLRLSDGTEEAWDPRRTHAAPSGALYTDVKANAPGGPYSAKFTRHAQASLAPVLDDAGGTLVAVVGGERVILSGIDRDFGAKPSGLR